MYMYTYVHRYIKLQLHIYTHRLLWVSILACTHIHKHDLMLRCWAPRDSKCAQKWSGAALTDSPANADSVSTRTAIRCSTLQHTSSHCISLQHTAAHCNTLQHTTIHCNTLQHIATNCNCSTLQRTATRKSEQGVGIFPSLQIMLHSWMRHVALFMSHTHAHISNVTNESRHTREPCCIASTTASCNEPCHTLVGSSVTSWTSHDKRTDQVVFYLQLRAQLRVATNNITLLNQVTNESGYAFESFCVVSVSASATACCNELCYTLESCHERVKLYFRIMAQ